MKKLLFILLVCSSLAWMDDIKPSTLKLLPTYSFSVNSVDSLIWMYGGNGRWFEFDTKSPWYAKMVLNGDTVIVPVHKKDTLSLTIFKLTKDSIIASGFVTQWKFKHKLDSVINLLVQYRKLNDHDSLSKLDERKFQSLTDTATWGLGITQSGHIVKIDTSDVSIPSRQRIAKEYVPVGRTITATAPITIDGGTSANLSANRTMAISAATQSVPGTMSAADKTKLDGIATGATANTGTVTSVAALTLGTTGTDLSSTVANGTTTPVITLNVPTASASNRGVLSAANWSTFNAKEPAITAGTTSQYYRGDKTWTAMPTSFDLANDTWTKVYDSAGNLSNFFMLSKDNIILPAFTLGIGSLFTVADAGKQIIANMPIVRSLANDTLQYSIGFGGFPTFKFRVIANGSGGYTDGKLIIDGTFVKLGGLSSQYMMADGSTSTGTGASTMVYPGEGIAISTGTGWGTSITNSSANWNTAYSWGNHASAGYLTSQTSHSDVVQDGDFTSQGIMLRGASSGTYSILTDNSSNWNTAYTNRITSLTTTGTSGAATLSSNTLNIPQYQPAGNYATGGGSATGTNTGDQDISAMTHSNRSALDLVSGTNTGDNSVNSLYSGLVTFPGFGGNGSASTASHSDHNHSGTYEVPLTFSTGLNRNGNTITNTITQYTDGMADARVTAGITGKENTITAGNSLQYWRGDKTWTIFPSLTDFTLLNDQYLYSTDFAGNRTPILKFSKDNGITFAQRVLINAFHFVQNQGFNYFADLPVSTLGVGVYHGTGIRIGGTDVLKVRGYGNSSGDIDSARVIAPRYQMTDSAGVNKIIMGRFDGLMRWSDTKYLFSLAANRILFASSANTMDQLPAATAGQILMGVTSSAPIWSTATYPNTAVSGHYLRGNGTGWIDTPTGFGIKSDSMAIDTTRILKKQTAATMYLGRLNPAVGLTASYINWNAVSGGAKILNRPNLYKNTQQFEDSATNGAGYIKLTSLSIDGATQHLAYDNTTGKFSVTSGYGIPTTANQTNWGTAYTNRITSLTTTGSSGAATLSSNTLNIPQYQAAGTYSTDIHSNISALNSVSGTNTGNDAVNSLYSGLAASKQNTITTGTTSQYFRGDLSLATFPTSLPASDVYSWAKQSTKPSYTYSEVGAQAAGSYLTSETDPNVPSWAKASSKPYVSNWYNDSGYLTSATLGTPWTGLGYITSSALSGYATTSALSGYLPLTGGSLSGALYTSAAIYGTSASFSSSISASDFCSSDIRLKNLLGSFDITDYNKVSKIQFHKYNFKSDTTKTVRYGVVAQEVEKVLPEMVTTDSKGMKAVNYVDMLVLLVAQQKEAIERLEKRIEILEKK